MAEGRVIQFTKFQDICATMPDPVKAALGTIPLRQALYERACREPTFLSGFDFGYTTRWRRWKWKVWRWLPRVHLGPCDHEGCQ